MNDIKVKKRVKVIYEIEVITGLHIGGSKDVYGIGGVDNPVIKNPINNEPIIPGSSIKGKVRMLLELMKKSDDEIRLINEIFGPKKNDKIDNPLTRVIFRDLYLNEKSKKDLQEALGEGFYTEIKAENTIDRTRGVSATPRFIERVPVGTIFTGEYIVQYLEKDKDDLYENLIEDGFKYLENNYLGGSGSRGYGKIAYHQIKKEIL